MFSIITLPTGALDDLFASAGTLFTDLWVIVAVAIGVPLAFYIINRAIGMVGRKAK